MSESLKELKPELENLSEKLQGEITNFLNHLTFTSDPVAAITGEKGRWLILNPFIKTKTLIDKIISSVSQELYKKSEGRYYIINASLDNLSKDLTLGIGYENNSPIIFWSIFSNKVSIPVWDGVYNRKSDRKRLIKLLKEKEKLLDETSIILNSPDALLNNGYFNLYLKRFFRRKKFETQAIDLITDLKIEVEDTRNELDSIKEFDFKIMEDQELLKCLDLLQLLFLRFPKYTKYSEYIKETKGEN